MKRGKIFLVGFGPGAEAHMSYRAKEAIAESDVVIGYSTYIKLVQELLDGKEVVRKGMTEELDRSIEAYEQAKQGKTVALISSGDIGVYGMAGPTYEVLLESGWTPESDIEVEVIPGSTALSACASLVGAPLTHDFCSISLSDLLTPWPVIRNRLDAAGASDFVIALYNPKSGRRKEQIVEAQRILLKYRKAETPVVIVKSAYRDKQDIQFTTLAEMADCKIGMLTTVLIGNSSTYIQEGLMITPRGYANKYDRLTGETKAGEQAGRSLTMGLDGWKNCIRDYIRQNPQQNFNKIVRHFAATSVDILSAISQQSGDDDNAAGFEAIRVDSSQLEALIDAAQQWGELRAVVRNEGGAISELLLHGQGFVRKGDWLNLENPHFHLHIDWSKVKGAWFLSRNDNLRSVHFLDRHGQTLFNLSLVRSEGRYNSEAEQQYQAAWQQLGLVEQTNIETETTEEPATA